MSTAFELNGHLVLMDDMASLGVLRSELLTGGSLLVTEYQSQPSAFRRNTRIPINGQTTHLCQLPLMIRLTAC